MRILSYSSCSSTESDSTLEQALSNTISTWVSVIKAAPWAILQIRSYRAFTFSELVEPNR